MVALIASGRRYRVCDFNCFLVTIVILFGASALVLYVFAGTVFGPLHTELTFQGILDPATAAQRQVTSDTMKSFPEMLFARPLGRLLAAIALAWRRAPSRDARRDRHLLVLLLPSQRHR